MPHDNVFKSIATKELTTDKATFQQTSTTGNTGYFYRNLASTSTDSPVVFIEQDNASDDQNSLNIQNDGTGNNLNLYNNGAGRGLYVETASGDDSIRIYHASGTNNGIHVDYRGTSEAIKIENTGTGNGLFIDQNGNGVGLNIDNAGTNPSMAVTQTQDVEVIDFDACTDGGTGHTTLAGSIKVQMPNGSTGYINLYT